LFGTLIDRYVREKLPKRHSTASKYRSWITHHVKPKWEGIPITKVKPLLVEEWLMSLDLAPKSKGHVRGSSDEKSGMKKRGGKKAALTVPKDGKSFQFSPRPSS
jgi:hypothetical protein